MLFICLFIFLNTFRAAVLYFSLKIDTLILASDTETAKETAARWFLKTRKKIVFKFLNLYILQLSVFLLYPFVLDMINNDMS